MNTVKTFTSNDNNCNGYEYTTTKRYIGDTAGAKVKSFIFNVILFASAMGVVLVVIQHLPIK